MGSRKIFFLIAVVVIVGVGIFMIRQRGGTGPDIFLKPISLPAVAVKDYTGADVSLAQFRGRPVVLLFWATWCPQCLKEAGDLLLLEKEFGERVVFVALNRGESSDVLRLVSGAIEGNTEARVYLFDPSDALYPAVGGFSMPEALFIDADGMIRFHKRGSMDFEETRRRIQDVFGL